MVFKKGKNSLTRIAPFNNIKMLKINPINDRNMHA